MQLVPEPLCGLETARYPRMHHQQMGEEKIREISKYYCYCVMKCNFKKVSGENVGVKISNLWFIYKDSTYFKYVY